MADIQFKHIPIMLEECMTALKLKQDAIYFDGTLGGAGHSYQILKRTSPNGRLIATDLDDKALLTASERLNEFKDRAILVKSNFKNFLQVLNDNNIDAIDGALLDLGVSSYQLDNRDRGFSYMAENVRLDMRMDNTTQKLSAYEVVNEYSEEKLKKILTIYGEERFSNKIAHNIVETRAKKPIETTGELVKIIEKSIPEKFKHDGHPAKRTFQAIRIEVNGELEGLDQVIYDIASKLKKGGRLAIITFHSLEDRIVKHTFIDLATGCTCDRSIPVCICHREKKCEIITKKPIVANDSEMIENPRSKSAKLRVLEKL